MSGGHFDYSQYRIGDISIEIEELIASNDSTDKDSFNQEVGRHYSSETISKFKETSKCLRLAQAMAQRVDWLVSGDDGEDSFHRRWEEEVTPLKSVGL